MFELSLTFHFLDILLERTKYVVAKSLSLKRYHCRGKVWIITFLSNMENVERAISAWLNDLKGSSWCAGAGGGCFFVFDSGDWSGCWILSDVAAVSHSSSINRNTSAVWSMELLELHCMYGNQKMKRIPLHDSPENRKKERGPILWMNRLRERGGVAIRWSRRQPFSLYRKIIRSENILDK